MYVIATAGFILISSTAAHRSPNPRTIALVLILVAAAQAAIGAMNDYCDREVDAAGNRRKPIVQELIAPWEAVCVGIVATILMLLAAFLLGWVAFALAIPIEGLGLAYDFKYKGTPVSGILFAVYFPLFPLLAWVVFGRWQPFLPWLVPLGALLGVATNIANSLPDLETDRDAGIRGLPHLLGLRAGLAIAWGAPLALLVICWALDLTGAVPAHALPLLLASAFGIAAVLLAAVRYRRRPTADTLRLNFIIQTVGMIALAAGWLAAVAF
jgi:4-hydroxybenzoate polyprenyltransferase